MGDGKVNRICRTGGADDPGKGVPCTLSQPTGGFVHPLLLEGYWMSIFLKE